MTEIVYLVFRDLDYEGYDVVSIHRTREGAEKKMATLKPDCLCLYFIDKMEVKE